VAFVRTAAAPVPPRLENRINKPRCYLWCSQGFTGKGPKAGLPREVRKGIHAAQQFIFWDARGPRKPVT